MPLARHDDWFDVASENPMRLVLVCRECGSLVDVAYKAAHLRRCQPASAPGEPS